jgi:hypothetical protein
MHCAMFVVPVALAAPSATSCALAWLGGSRTFARPVGGGSGVSGRIETLIVRRSASACKWSRLGWRSVLRPIVASQRPWGGFAARREPPAASCCLVVR